MNVNIYAISLTETSGQLPFLGKRPRGCWQQYRRQHPGPRALSRTLDFSIICDQQTTTCEGSGKPDDAIALRLLRGQNRP